MSSCFSLFEKDPPALSAGSLGGGWGKEPRKESSFFCVTAASKTVTHVVGHRCPTLQSIYISPTTAQVLVILQIQEGPVVILKRH